MRNPYMKAIKMVCKQLHKQTPIVSRSFTLKPVVACIRFVLTGGMMVGSVSPLHAAGNLPVPSAVWASMGSATNTVVGNTMQIDQQTDRAILNWQSFNIGANNSVEFKQPNSNSIALNKIFQNDPSQILGSMTANGQVYLVNSNGFVFGKDAKVDVRGMVASTLDISDEVFKQGITKVFANDGSAAFNGNGNFYLKNADGSFKLDADGNKIKTAIKIENGAQINTMAGGQNILIIAPTIINEGHIEADDRQVVLAAATDKVYLQESGNDGLLVEVKTGGEIKNLGEIASKRGIVSMVGFAVNQEGKVSASTSLNINGKIRLVAREGATTFQTADGFAMQAGKTTRASDNGDGLGSSATVTFGKNSRTEVLPELKDGKTAIDEQAQPQSQVDIMGHKVLFQNGSKVTVPSGVVNVVATENPSNPLQASTNRNSSRILVDSGAKIDVSGIDTAVKPMDSNVVEIELRLNQLNDAPLQRNGVLFGKTILVDLRKGTPLTDIQPNIDAIERTLGERLANGGEINLSSEGDTLINKNANLDFSGGAVKYLPGYLETTLLISNGRLVDISEADPYLTYDGIYGKAIETNKKWGIEKVFTAENPFALARKEDGYIEGHDAGKLNIKSPNVLIDGQLNGGTVRGRLQRALADRPQAGSLTIDMRSASEVDQDVVIGNKLNNASVNVDLNQPFPLGNDNQSTPLTLQTQMLSQSDIQNIAVLAHGEIKLAGNSKLQLADGGTLTLQGGAINVAGQIKGAGAQVILGTDLNAKTQTRLSGDITLSKGSKIDLQGGWVNDQATPFDFLERFPITIDGGQFSASANGNIDFQTGSRIDVSAGAWLTTSGKVVDGKAGVVEMHAVAENTGSNILLDGVLSAYGLRQGGTLNLEANGVAILRRREEELDGLHPLQINADFFGKGGFANYQITSNINGLQVNSGAKINLKQLNRVLEQDAIMHGNADSIAAFSKIERLPIQERLPSSLVLKSVHSINPNPDSRLDFSENAEIVADPLSTVSLISDASLFFNGAITARGGNVSLDIIPPQGLSTLDPLYQPQQANWLGERARIDVSGIAITTTDLLGGKTGEVFDGGNVSLNAARGFIVTNAGSEINVAGTAESLNFPLLNPNSFRVSYQAKTQGSHAGSIDMVAAEGIFISGSMQAQGGHAAGTSGGNLSVRLDDTVREVPVEEGIQVNFPTAPGVMNFSQQKIGFFNSQFFKAGDALPVNLQRTGFLSAQQVKAAGFANLSLQSDGEIRFAGDVNLKVQQAIQLDAPKLSWQRLNAGDTGRVVLSAAQALVGSSRTRTVDDKPSNGDGWLTVNADLIELYGGSFTDGFKQVDFNATSDIRLRGIQTLFTQREYLGEFDTYAKLNLTADQVYPTTLSDFILKVEGAADGTIRFNGGNQRRPILSAFSKLTVSAPNIEQNGTIQVPFGNLILDAANTLKFGADSLTSVSAAGQTIPFGITEGGLEWLYPIGNQNLIVQSPQKNISIKADKILRNEGAVIDLSGGGDLQAYEFIPGIGGSKDVLDTDQAYAVLPGFKGYAPYDPLQTPNSGLALGDKIYLGAGSGLAAGQYTLLPAHYALLPGAYLITPQADSQNMIPGSQLTNIYGAPVVAGYRTIAATGIKEQVWSGFAVEPGTIALSRSELHLSSANDFFSQQAATNETALPRLPKDAGSLVFDAKSQLDLPIVYSEAAKGGLAGLVDVVAENIAVVNSKTGINGVVELAVKDLDAFDIGSLLLGGIRTVDGKTGDIDLEVKSKTVTVAENTKLQVAEVILSATDTVELKAGAQVVAESKKPTSELGSVLITHGDGALLRVATGAQAQTVRSDTLGLKGDLLVRNGANIESASGSILLDSTRDLQMAGELNASNSLNIGAETINLGEVSSGLAGLSLSNEQLSRLNINELVLTSRKNVNIYGAMPAFDNGFQFNHLIIDAQGFAGFANAGKTATLSADHMTLMNKSLAGAALNGTGTGALSIQANQLDLAGGDFLLSGFSDVQLKLTQSLTGLADSKLSALSNLAIKAGYIDGKTGSNTHIDASGYNLSIEKSADTAISDNQDVAAQLHLLANRVVINAPLMFKAGQVTAEAINNDVVLGGNALIDVSGDVVRAGLSASQQLSAGQIGLTAQQGNVSTLAGSQMLLNGTIANMAAGSLAVSAANGQINLDGVIDAHGGDLAAAGSIAIDVDSMSDSRFSDLNHMFVDAGFANSLDLRVRNGDLSVAQQDVLRANRIKLTADTGKLTVAGTLNTDNNDGGNIELNSYQQLRLASTARLDAQALAENGNGGNVKLSSVDGGGIEIQSGALINVSANGGSEGEIHLRAERLAGSDVNIAPITTGSIVGDSNVTIEAVARYNMSVLDSSAINTIKTETATYMDTVSGNAVFTNKFGQGYTLAPGVEVVSQDNLTLAAAWNLVDWRYGVDKTPGFLTLRAGRDLLLKKDLSDAFANGVINVTPTFTRSVTDMLQPGLSWSYSLAAGADIQSADIAAVTADVNPAYGDIRLSNNVKVRTGTGNIDFFAARDIAYGNDSSVVYTAGRPDEVDRFGLPILRVASNFYVEYPLDGGDINFQAGRNILGAATNQIVSDWLLKTGNWSSNLTHEGERPTAWGIAVGTRVGSNVTPDYRQNVGALGGGNVTVTAGGNISDLSVVIPTTGKQVGQRAEPDNLTNQDYLTNQVQINGGGDLQVTAGGDVKGGMYYVDGGTATMTVAGALSAGSFKTATHAAMNPILALGDAQFSITAGKDIAVQAIIDPMILPQPANKKPDLASIFFRYANDSGVSLTSVGGTINLGNDVSGVIDLLNSQRSAAVGFEGAARESVLVAPPTLKAYALSGDIVFNNSLMMYPSSNGQFELFAANNIVSGLSGNNINVTMSDTDPAFLPSVANPAANYTDASLRLVLSGISNEPDKIYAATPNHINDTQPVLISTATGDILGNDPFQLIMAKQAQVSAGNDIRNVSLQFQNNFADADSIVSAGRDFKFDIVRSPATGALVNLVQRLEVSGPGRLSVLAGRNVDLGSSEGITSTGNQVNAALSEDGASIDVLAGLGQTKLAVGDFIKNYLASDSELSQAYNQSVTVYMQRISGNQAITGSAALTAFNQLSDQEQSHFNAQYLANVISTFNNKMSEYGKKFSIAKSGFDNTKDQNEQFQFKQQMDNAQLEILAAIETLFPDSTILTGNQTYSVDPGKGIVFKDGSNASTVLSQAFSVDRKSTRLQTGDISMFFSKIHTTDGGDINLLTPNGGVNAGLAVNSSGAKDASQLGVVALKAGAIDAIVRDNFQVNTTRVMTLGGGDIMIGSTEGNIDAGRGAKTALAAPTPIVRFDNKGNMIVELPPAVAGSGIRANMAPDGKQGDALLFALEGTIDVSEAGLGGKSVTVGATAIVGSDNIDVGGVSVGIPVASVGSIAAGLGNISNSAAASIAQALDSEADVTKAANEKIANAAAMGIISIDILGFGDEDS